MNNVNDEILIAAAAVYVTTIVAAIACDVIAMFDCVACDVAVCVQLLPVLTNLPKPTEARMYK